MEIRTGTIVKVTKTDPLFDRVKFVVAARLREKGYYFATQYIFSDSTRLVATDGHRLHCGEDINIPAGLYAVILNTPTLVSLEEVAKDTFPEFEKLLSEELDKTGYSPEFIDFIDYAVVAKMLPDGAGINYEYFKDLHKHCSTMFCSSEPQKVIIFRGENTTAVVMPFLM
jgi:hypothetical protein